MSVATAVSVPRHLRLQPPGPELAGLLAGIDPARVTNDEIVEVLVAQARQLAHEQARLLTLIAEVGRCAPFAGEGEVERLPHLYQYSGEEIRVALTMGSRAVDREQGFAEDLVHRLPEVHAALDAGEIDRAKASVFSFETTMLTDEQAVAVCAELLPRARRLTPGQLAFRLRRLVIGIDPSAAARRYKRAVRDRGVTGYLDADGTVVITASGLPADEALLACERVRELAEAARAAGHPGLRGQIEADLFLGMIDGRFQGMTGEGIVAALIAQAARDAEPSIAEDGERPAPAASASTEHNAAGPAANEGADHGTPATTFGAEGETADDGTDDAVNISEPAADVARAEFVDDAPAPAAPGPAVLPGVEVRAEITTLMGRDERPGDVAGAGAVLAPVARALVARQRPCTWRFAVTNDLGYLLSEGVTRRRPTPDALPLDARTPCRGGIVELQITAAQLDELVAEPGSCDGWAGVIADVAAQHRLAAASRALLDHYPHRRFPTAALQRHIEVRDRSCVFPGCRRRASRSEIDHTVDHARGGPTVSWNLGPLCVKHHHYKHQAGWLLKQLAPGWFVWDSPLGLTVLTRGEPVIVPLGEPAEAGPQPGEDTSPSARCDGPIIYIPEPKPPPDPPPLRNLDDSDEPPPF
ncbi:MAG: DUF222 domain-containing protein [Pseudonocardia sp.]